MIEREAANANAIASPQISWNILIYGLFTSQTERKARSSFSATLEIQTKQFNAILRAKVSFSLSDALTLQSIVIHNSDNAFTSSLMK